MQENKQEDTKVSPCERAENLPSVSILNFARVYVYICFIYNPSSIISFAWEIVFYRILSVERLS